MCGQVGKTNADYGKDDFMVHDEHTKSKSNSNSSSSDPDSAFRSRVLARMLSKINQTANFGNGNPPAQFTAAGDGISLTPHNTSSADERAGVGGPLQTPGETGEAGGE